MTSYIFLLFSWKAFAESLICKRFLPSAVSWSLAFTSSSSTSACSFCSSVYRGTGNLSATVSTSIFCWFKTAPKFNGLTFYTSFGAYSLLSSSPSTSWLSLESFSGANPSPIFSLLVSFCDTDKGMESLKSSRGKEISASSLSPWPSITAMLIICCFSCLAFDDRVD